MLEGNKVKPRRRPPFLREGSLGRSFNRAIAGIVHAVRTQRNVKIHLAVTVVVLIASIFLSITKIELIILLLTVGLVLITEMMNSALELVLDLTVDRYHPLARVAKDVGAGAVLFAALTALLVGYLIFFERLKSPLLTTIVAVRRAPEHVAVVTVGVTLNLVIVLKALTGRGTWLRGGLPSGHAAIAFGVWVAITLVAKDPLVAALTGVLAFTIAISRVRMGIHSVLEVTTGALLGTGVAALCFWIFT